MRAQSSSKLFRHADVVKTKHVYKTEADMQVTRVNATEGRRYIKHIQTRGTYSISHAGHRAVHVGSKPGMNKIFFYFPKCPEFFVRPLLSADCVHIEERWISYISETKSLAVCIPLTAGTTLAP